MGRDEQSRRQLQIEMRCRQFLAPLSPEHFSAIGAHRGTFRLGQLRLRRGWRSDRLGLPQIRELDLACIQGHFVLQNQIQR